MPSSYIRGPYAIASVTLMDHLKTLGIVANVGYAVRNRNRTIIAIVSSGDLSKVPAEWRGFTVRAERERNAD